MSSSSSSPVIGFAICGSFCTFSQILAVLHKLTDRFNVIPILSPFAASTDTRFGLASLFIRSVESICSNPIISSIPDAEPIGPNRLLDLLIIAPCTGNTIAKIANGITDSPVSMAYKAHLRNSRPVLIAVSSNDALAANAPNIALLLNRKHNFFVPFFQDDPFSKPNSLIADFNLIPEAVDAALANSQLQPLLRLPPS